MPGTTTKVIPVDEHYAATIVEIAAIAEPKAAQSVRVRIWRTAKSLNEAVCAADEDDMGKKSAPSLRNSSVFKLPARRL